MANTNLVSLLEAQPEVDELKAFIVCAPQDVARFEVSVDVAFPVEEGQSLQDVSGTVLHQPHGVALLGSAQYDQTLGNTPILESVV